MGEIFRRFGAAYRDRHGKSMPLRHHRAMRAIELCRTGALGGRVLQCDSCGKQQIVYNSCRNRHCPTCQGLATVTWLAAQEASLLPVGYFQVVFTLPEALHPVALRNQRVVYNILFRAACETLLSLACDPKHLGADIGITAVLHTWNQQLLDHPHLHCLVPSGGLSPEGRRWLSFRSDFFMPGPVIARMFRGKVLSYLKQAYKEGKLVFAGALLPLSGKGAFCAHLDVLYGIDWVVHIEPPVAGPEHLLSYLGRYIHRVAIGNERIVAIDGDQVTISYLDRNDGNKRKKLALSAEEFIRRFLLHILPEGFVKIRHYGLLSNRQKKMKFAQALKLLHRQGLARKMASTFQALLEALTGSDGQRCPACGKGVLVLVETLWPQPVRAPPEERTRVA